MKMKQKKKNLNVVRQHTLPEPEGLKKVAVVLDVGAGIRPMQWYQPQHHICIDPYEPYCKVLRDSSVGYEVYCLTATRALQPDVFMAVDSVYLLDVIEHMEKDDALRILSLARQVAQVQVVVYTPYGFVEQTEDKWGLEGHSWQTHRSGWLPEEFHDLGWRTQLLQPNRKPQPQGIYALWEARA